MSKNQIPDYVKSECAKLDEIFNAWVRIDADQDSAPFIDLRTQLWTQALVVAYATYLPSYYRKMIEGNTSFVYKGTSFEYDEKAVQENSDDDQPRDMQINKESSEDQSSISSFTQERRDKINDAVYDTMLLIIEKRPSDRPGKTFQNYFQYTMSKKMHEKHPDKGHKLISLDEPINRDGEGGSLTLGDIMISQDEIPPRKNGRPGPPHAIEPAQLDPLKSLLLYESEAAIITKLKEMKIIISGVENDNKRIVWAEKFHYLASAVYETLTDDTLKREIQILLGRDVLDRYSRKKFSGKMLAQSLHCSQPNVSKFSALFEELLFKYFLKR